MLNPECSQFSLGPPLISVNSVELSKQSSWAMGARFLLRFADSMFIHRGER
jgi:hypothetical protein